MATTSPDNLYYPVGTDFVGPLQTVLSNMASSSQTALVNRFKSVTVPVANQTARDTLFPSPVQGNSVKRLDLGWVEQYYAAYDSSSNQVGAKTAGWYPSPNAGPLATAVYTASSAVIPAATASAAARWGGWTTQTKLGMVIGGNSEFTIPYEGIYEVTYGMGSAASSQNAYVQISGGTGTLLASSNGSGSGISGAAMFPANAGDAYSLFAQATSGTTTYVVRNSTTYLAVKWIGVRQV